MEINPATASRSLFLQKNSAAIRIWHWITFLVITSLIVTVLLASTTLSPRENMPVVQDILKAKGIVADNTQTFAVTHFYDDKMWNLHKILGIALSFLFLSRMVIELTRPKEERNKTRLKLALLTYLQSEKEPEKKELRHYLIVKYVYLLSYMMLLLMVITGLMLSFGPELGFTRQTGRTIKEIHGFIQYFLYAFFFFHLVGVILADLGKSRGIVSGMINGNQ